MAELKRCAHCGGTAEFYKSSYSGNQSISEHLAKQYHVGKCYKYWFIVCTECGIKTKPYRTKKAAAELWNRSVNSDGQRSD